MSGRRWLVVMALLSAMAGPLAAQERIDLFARVGSRTLLVEVDASVSGFGRVIDVINLPDNAYYVEPVVLAGGRYVVWVAGFLSDHVMVFDRRTRRVTEMTDRLPRGPWPWLLADPDRPRLFLQDSFKGIGVLDAATGEFRLLYEGFTWPGLAYAPVTDELFVSEVTHPGQIVVLDVATGTVRTRIPTEGVMGGLQVDRRGRRVYAFRLAPAARIVAYDPESGAIAARSQTMVAASFVLDERRSRLLVTWPNEGRVAVLDAVSLQTLGAARVAAPPGTVFNIRGYFDVLPGRWMTGVYVLRVEQREQPMTCNAIDIDALDPLGRRRATLDVLAHLGPGGTGCFATAALVRSPFAPESLAASVIGRRATLTWENPGDVSEFEIQVGLVPGTTIMARRVGPTTTVSFDQVPPGAYYARVRAFNEVGGSPVSNEVRVVVP